MTSMYITESTEAPQTVSEASPAAQVAGGAEGAPATSQSDPGPVEMDERIVAAFGDAARSDEVGRLVAEVTDAASAADAVAKEARTRALDPLLSRDAVAITRRQAEDAAFESDRLAEAAKRLRERLVELKAIEIARAMGAAHDALSAHRDRLVGEMEGLSGAIAQISRVAVQVEALEREIKRQNPILGKTLGYLPPILAAASPIVRQLFSDAAVLDSFVSIAMRSPSLPSPSPPSPSPALTIVSGTAA
jgi:hypothetical protein